MSRIGKKPVEIPTGVQVAVSDRVVSVEGPQGKLQLEHRPEVNVTIDEENTKGEVPDKLFVEISNQDGSWASGRSEISDGSEVVFVKLTFEPNGK